jgi:peptidoglycan/LPS O-acetylase OafA/YrhL
MLVLLPDPWSSGPLYPANGVFWSLLFEMIAYVAFALIAPRLGMLGLATLAAIGGLALVSLALFGDYPVSEFGVDWSTIPHGMARVGYSFTCGVLIYRLREVDGLPGIIARRAWLLPGAFVLLVVLEPALGPLAGLLSILIALPSLLWLATKWEIPHIGLAEVLSDLSYPLYCIQLPILSAAVFFDLPSFPTWGSLIALSLLLARYWDRPMRHTLRGWAEGGRGVPKPA